RRPVGGWRKEGYDRWPFRAPGFRGRNSGTDSHKPIWRVSSGVRVYGVCESRNPVRRTVLGLGSTGEDGLGQETNARSADGKLEARFRVHESAAVTSLLGQQETRR